MESFLLLLAYSAADPAALRFEPGVNPTLIRVIAHLPDTLLPQIPDGKLKADIGERFLQLTLIPDKTVKSQPILGAYERRGSVLTYTPRFALAHEQTYRATLFLDDRTKIEKDYRVPKRDALPATVVERIYPTADELPANLLKFYIHFSKPMREGRAVFDQIQLLDADGKPVEDPWRRTELWNEDATRLTLWIHPGRIKEGVNLREEFGPVLEPDRKYTLIVGEKMLDTDGQPLGKPCRKVFRTTASVQKAIDLSEWVIRAPKADGKDRFEVRFLRPLDRALLDRFLTVKDHEGKELMGRIRVTNVECTWSFEPQTAWKAGRYSLHVDDRLEDLAGNTPLRPFDFNRKLPEVKDPCRVISFAIEK